MSHHTHPQPWYRKDRGWFLTLNGKQIRLGRSRDDAFRRYHQIMAQQATHPGRRTLAAEVTLAEVIEEFLDYVSKERAEDTYESYRYKLKRLHDYYPNMLAEEIRPIDVRKWVDTYDIGRTTRHNYLRSVKTCFAFAQREGLINTNPVARIRVPKPDIREVYIPFEEFQLLLSLVPCQAFRDLMICTYETGCRPQESKIVEARHVDIGNQRWIIPKSSEKMRRVTRIVYMSDAAMEITRRRMQQFPTGPLFRNSNSRSWNKHSVGCGFGRLQVRLGKLEMKRRELTIGKDEIGAYAKRLSRTRKHQGRTMRKTDAELRQEAKQKLTVKQASQLAPRYCLYALRHSFATNCLKRGLDALTVAVLMGHSDPSTLAKVYQHLSHAPGHLLGQLRAATTQPHTCCCHAHHEDGEA